VFLGKGDVRTPPIPLEVELVNSFDMKKEEFTAGGLFFIVVGS